MFPERFTEHRIRIVSMLRMWLTCRVQPDEDDTYPVTRLIGQVARGEIWPAALPDFALEWPRRAALLGYVVLACLIRKAPAVRGSRDEWGTLLGVSARTAWNDLQYLVEHRWLELMPQFVAHRSYGRNGEVLHHRQQCNWYRPARKLREKWERFCADREAEAQRFGGKNSVIPETEPTRFKGGNDCQASAFGLRRHISSTPTGSELIHSSLPCSSDAVSDGEKVSPPAIVVLGSPAATSIGAADGGGAVASGARQRADQEMPAQRRAHMQDSRRRRPMTEEEKRLIDRIAPDRSTASALHRAHRDDDDFGRDLARMLAKALQQDAYAHDIRGHQPSTR